jgi:hypothetical protein
MRSFFVKKARDLGDKFLLPIGRQSTKALNVAAGDKDFHERQSRVLSALEHHPNGLTGPAVM